LWDTTCLIVGVIIGAGIYQAPTQVFQNVTGPWQALGVWLVGGLLSIAGALCFAELASTYPRSGGDYVYLTRAYGSWVGFFFAWAQLAVIRSGGGIAAVAYVFADYARVLCDFRPESTPFCAATVIAVLTFINILGVNPGKRTQNALTVAKVLGLAGIIVAGFSYAAPRANSAAAAPSGTASLAIALLFVLYTYDGWNEAAYVVGEVNDWRRNVPRALIVGPLVVMGIYLLVNAALLVGLGFERASSSKAIVADLLALPLGGFGARIMSLLVMISTLGAINGTIFAGSRIYPELGADHPVFAPLNRWNSRLGTPVTSLLAQAAVSIVLVVAVGVIWQSQDGFEMLLKYTSAVFWLFFFLTALALFVLRYKDEGIERPFRVPAYPWLPLLFCGWSGFMLCGSIIYAPKQSLLGLGILLLGLPFYFWFPQRTRLPHPALSGPLSIRRSAGRPCQPDPEAFNVQ
jgi:amino acid transporter